MARISNSLKDLAHKIGEAVSTKGYVFFGQGDRHGSYEWTWWKAPDDGEEIARFVILAITLRSGPSGYKAEVWAGAHRESIGDDKVVHQQFTRTLIDSFMVKAPKELFTTLPYVQLFESVTKALTHTEALALEDLRDSGNGHLIQSSEGVIKEVQAKPEEDSV